MNTNIDWTGSKNSAFKIIGASNHCDEEREANDYYATDPVSVKALLEIEKFNHHVWECACGGGHISDILIDNNYEVVSTDLIDRGYDKGVSNVNFLETKYEANSILRDIITNPPYKYAKEFVEKAIDIIQPGYKVAMFLKLTFLEGQERRKLFDIYPPKTIYVFSKRQECAKNGEFGKGSAVAYAWFIWEKGYKADPIIKWI